MIMQLQTEGKKTQTQICYLTFLNAHIVKTIPQQETFQTCVERVGSQTVTGSVKSDYFGLNPIFQNNEVANFSFIVLYCSD